MILSKEKKKTKKHKFLGHIKCDKARTWQQLTIVLLVFKPTFKEAEKELDLSYEIILILLDVANARENIKTSKE